jgi:hypothetical protein
MVRCLCRFLVSLLVALLTSVQPQFSRAGAGELYDGFLDPPRDYSPMPFWFWNGKMEGPKIQEEIRQMTDQHVYGAFLHARDGLETP